MLDISDVEDLGCILGAALDTLPGHSHSLADWVAAHSSVGIRSRDWSTKQEGLRGPGPAVEGIEVRPDRSNLESFLDKVEKKNRDTDWEQSWAAVAS